MNIKTQIKCILLLALGAFLLCFVVLLENLAKSLGKPLTIIIGLIGIGLYTWPIISLFDRYIGFSIGLIAVAVGFAYFGYHAYFTKKGKDN